jgi:hypothetical protein
MTHKRHSCLDRHTVLSTGWQKSLKIAVVR